MRRSNGVRGKIGDVSGKIGDVSGKIGDVSGKIGDVSGVDGKIGDVSGDSPLSQVEDFLMQDRSGDKLYCLQMKIHRLENEVLAIARWLDARIISLEGDNNDLFDGLGAADDKITGIGEVLVTVDERLDALEHTDQRKPGKQPNYKA